MSDFDPSASTTPREELEQHPWLIAEAGGDRRLLELLVRREVAIDDAVVEHGGSLAVDQGPVRAAYRQIHDHTGTQPTSTNTQ